MRIPALFAALLGLASGLSASPWGLDLGVRGAFGLHRFAGEAGGLPPSTDPNNLFNLYPPSVQASGGMGLAGDLGPELALHYERRYYLSVQMLATAQQLSLDEGLRFADGTELQRQLRWSWQGARFPVELSYAYPLSHSPTQAFLLRLGAGAWYEHVQDRKKTLSSGGQDLPQDWAGPPDDWGPQASLGVDVLSLPSGKRLGSIGLTAFRGTALQDPRAGAGLPIWTLQLQVTVGVWMWVL